MSHGRIIHSDYRMHTLPHIIPKIRCAQGAESMTGHDSLRLQTRIRPSCGDGGTSPTASVAQELGRWIPLTLISIHTDRGIEPPPLLPYIHLVVKNSEADFLRLGEGQRK